MSPREKRKGCLSGAWSLHPIVGGAELSHLVEWSFIGLRMWGSLPPFLILAYPQNMGTRSVCPQQPAVWRRPPGWRGAIAGAPRVPWAWGGRLMLPGGGVPGRRPRQSPSALRRARPQVPRCLRRWERWPGTQQLGQHCWSAQLGNEPGEISHSSSVGGYMHVFV